MLLLALASSSEGPSVQVKGWLAWLIIGGAISLAVLAMGELWIRVARPLLKGLETLAQIANEFQPNSGATLHDTITAIRRDTSTALQERQGLENQIGELHDKLEQLWDYSHDFKHEVVNGLTKVGLATDVVKRLAAQIGPHPERMDDK